MPEGGTLRRRLEAWRVAEFLRSQPGMRILPSGGDGLVLSGNYKLNAYYPGKPVLNAEYTLRISVPPDFPRDLPVVTSPNGDIARDFHTNPRDQSLCLGSPLRLRYLCRNDPDLAVFVERCLVPYLYSYTHLKHQGALPFGELKHDSPGLLEDYMQLFRVKTAQECRGMLALLALRRRLANKRPCPCKSGRRLGRCHNRLINPMRRICGRGWFRGEAKALIGSE